MRGGGQGDRKQRAIQRHRHTDLWIRFSAANTTGAYGAHCCAGDGDVYYWRSAHLWDYHQLHAFLPGGAGFLGCIFRTLERDGRWGRAECMLLIYRTRMRLYPLLIFAKYAVAIIRIGRLFDFSLYIKSSWDTAQMLGAPGIWDGGCIMW